MRLTHLLFLFASLTISYSSTHYYIGDQGLSCNQVCFKQVTSFLPNFSLTSPQRTRTATLESLPMINTTSSPHWVSGILSPCFHILNIILFSCKASKTAWNSQAQPAYVNDKKSSNYGKCMGYIDVPAAGHCHARFSLIPNTSNSHPLLVTLLSKGFVDAMILKILLQPLELGMPTVTLQPK